MGQLPFCSESRETSYPLRHESRLISLYTALKSGYREPFHYFLR